MSRTSLVRTHQLPGALLYRCRGSQFFHTPNPVDEPINPKSKHQPPHQENQVTQADIERTQGPTARARADRATQRQQGKLGAEHVSALAKRPRVSIFLA